MKTAESGLISSKDYRRPKRTIPIALGSTVGAVKPRWLDGIADRCRELTDLAPNWDTYGAPPVSAITAQAAIALLGQVAPETLVEPRVVPTVAGGLQFDWKVGSRELQVAFVGPAQVSVFFTDEQTGEEFERELVNDLAPLSDLFKKLDPGP